MQKSYTFYHNTGFWFLLLIPLVALGFYPTYFSVFLKPTPTLVHFHFTLMAIWIVILMLQPFLYRYNKLALHRTVGKLTYVLVPMLLVTAFLMIRFSYYRMIGDLTLQSAQGTISLDHNQILNETASYETIAFIYFTWLAVLYSLAIYYRKQSPIHARFMVATALTMMGPTVDRIVYALVKSGKIAGNIPIESVAFSIVDITLALLLWNDYRKGRSTRAFLTSLLIFLGGQIFFLMFQNNSTWQSFVNMIMKPAP